jgi:hypothetical protein
LGRRSRKRPAPAAEPRRPRAPLEPPAAAEPSRPSRSETRAAEARSRLEPLPSAQRPLPVTISAVVALVIAVANIVAWLAGLEVRGERPALAGILVLSALMAACAAGLWRMRYWAVLGFEAMLALTVVYAALSLTVADNLGGFLLPLALIGLGGWLFYKLVRIMARLQMPTRAPRS